MNKKMLQTLSELIRQTNKNEKKLKKILNKEEWKDYLHMRWHTQNPEEDECLICGNRVWIKKQANG